MRGQSPLAQGDVVLIKFPFTDLSAQKVRPAIIVGRVAGDDVIVAFVTSQPLARLSPAWCLIDPQHHEFGATGLRATSTVRLDKLATLERQLVRRRLGSIGPQLATAVTAAIRHVFGL